MDNLYFVSEIMFIFAYNQIETMNMTDVLIKFNKMGGGKNAPSFIVGAYAFVEKEINIGS